MNKLQALWTLLTSEHYVLVTQKRRHSCTPKWGGKAFWKSARASFDVLDKQAILQWVADEVVGKQEPKTMKTAKLADKYLGFRNKLLYRNYLRYEQRAILKQHGWINKEEKK